MTTQRSTESLRKVFFKYDEFHRNPQNEMCHWIGIPLVVFSLLGLLAQVQILTTDLGFGLVVLTLIYHFSLDWKLALPFFAVALGSYGLAKDVSPLILWILFALGWFFQLFGHYYYEKKSPAFFTNLKQLLVGPLWLFARLIRYR